MMLEEADGETDEGAATAVTGTVDSEAIAIDSSCEMNPQPAKVARASVATTANVLFAGLVLRFAGLSLSASSNQSGFLLFSMAKN